MLCNFRAASSIAMPMRRVLLILPLLLLAACGGNAPSSSNGECEESAGITYRTDGQLTFFRADSTEIREIAIEVVDTDSTRGRGLMARKCIPSDWGMLFVFPEERSQAFYMANTPRALDIMFFAADSSLINAAKYTTPNSLDRVFSEGGAQFVVETPAGFVDRHGLAPGDYINWKLDSAEPSAESEGTPVMDSSLVN